MPTLWFSLYCQTTAPRYHPICNLVIPVHQTIRMHSQCSRQLGRQGSSPVFRTQLGALKSYYSARADEKVATKIVTPHHEPVAGVPRSLGRRMPMAPNAFPAMRMTLLFLLHE